MQNSENLYDCFITYHLSSGQTIEEVYKKDIPKEVWNSIREQFLDPPKYIEINPNEKYDKLLLPKGNLSYITMRVESQ